MAKTNAMRPWLLPMGLLLMVACGDKTTDLTGNDGGTAGDDGGTAGDDGGTAGCTSTLQCPAGQVCDPGAGTCASEVPCFEHADCGMAAFCDTGGRCARSDTGSPCAGDENCLPSETCTGNFCGCEGEVFAAENVPPNLLIVLDRSSSMNGSLGGGQTRWTVALSTIADMLAAAGDSIRFGLALYPGTTQSPCTGTSCGPGAVFIDPAPGTESAINDFLANASRCSLGTPTAAMMDALLGYSGLLDPERDNYVMLVTDGESTCNNDPTDEVAALQAQTPTVKTFVVGYVDGDPNELNSMAMAGGTAIAGGPPYYYDATDATSLAAAFQDIAGNVLSCSYTLSGTPTDLDKLYVYQDGDEVARDTSHADGWDYDPDSNQLTFYGPACDALRSGAVTDLVIVFGCPIPID